MANSGEEGINNKVLLVGFLLGIAASFIANIIFHNLSSSPSNQPVAKWSSSTKSEEG